MFQKYIVLLQLQIKSAGKIFPKILAGILLFSIIIGLMVMSAIVVSEETKEPEKMSVAVVTDAQAELQDIEYVKMAFSMIQQVPSVKNSCEFRIEQSKKQAVEDLKRGEITAVILIPRGFVSGILYGKSVPATVIFDGGMTSLSVFLLEQLMQAGAADLNTAQSGIYAVEQIMDMHSEWIQTTDYRQLRIQTEEAFNQKYFRMALERGSYFHNQIVYSRGKITIHQFYLAAVVCMILLLIGIPCVTYFKKDKMSLFLQLRQDGISVGIFLFVRTLAITLVLTMFVGLIYVFLLLATIRYPQLREWIYLQKNTNVWIATAMGLAGIFVTILTMYQQISMLYTGIQQEVTGVLALFLLTIIGAYVGGLLLPESMLPEVLRTLNNILPIQWSFRLITQIVTGQLQLQTIGVNIAIGAVFYIVEEILVQMRIMRL